MEWDLILVKRAKGEKDVALETLPDGTENSLALAIKAEEIRRGSKAHALVLRVSRGAGMPSGKNRGQRRAEVRTTRRLISGLPRRLRKVFTLSREEQAAVDAEVGEAFEGKEDADKRA